MIVLKKLPYSSLPAVYDNNTFLKNTVWILYGVFIYLVLRIITTDPGIIPKDTFSESLRRIILEESLFMSMRAYEKNEKNYCVVCHHNMPEKTFHCRRCNCCVLDLDHHCKALGSCIGKRNYHFFVLMLFVLLIINVIAFTISTSLFYQEFSTTGRSEWLCILFKKYPLSGALQLTTSLMFFPITYMNTLHCKLISCEVGTYYYFLHTYNSPPDNGMKKFTLKKMLINYFKLFKKPKQPSLLRIGHVSDDKLLSIIRN
uniref:Palmitoyltransferase n=1 Tax=Strongyloides venezuelensis TaxID=75913 RepID=A0A0K0G1F8_STRVS